MQLFSVIIPTYNRPNLLQRAISSVMVQSLKNFELIIVDDGSEYNYAQQLADQIQDQRIYIIQGEKNSGVAAARNLGIAFASGTYISFLDDDDEYSENFLEITASHLLHTDSSIAATFSCVTSIGTDQQSTYSELQSSNIFASSEEISRNFLSIGAGCGVTIKSACLRKVGLFNESFTVGEDTELFIRILSMGYHCIELPPNLVKVYCDASQRLTDASYADRLRVYEWIRVVYFKFLSQHSILRESLSPNLISGMANPNKPGPRKIIK